MACGCLRSAFDYNTRAFKAFPSATSFVTYKSMLTEKLQDHFKAQGEIFEDMDVQDYPDKGFVRRELYPWNEYEPDRFAPKVLQSLNDELDQIAPKLEVRVTELPLLRCVRTKCAQFLSSDPYFPSSHSHVYVQ
jgi:hypothetical protein